MFNFLHNILSAIGTAIISIGLLFGGTHTVLIKATSTSDITVVSTSTPRIVTSTTTTIINTIQDKQNYEPLLETFINGRIENFNNLNQWIASTSEVFDSRLDMLNKLMSSNQATFLASSNPTFNSIGQMFNQLYLNDASTTNSYKSQINFIVSDINSAITTLQTNKNNAKGTSVSKQSFLSDANTLNQWDTAWSVAQKAVVTVLTNYNNWANYADAGYNQAWSSTDTFLNNYSSNYTNYVSSNYIPPVQVVNLNNIPKMPVVCTFNANTSFSGDSGYTNGSGMCQ